MSDSSASTLVQRLWAKDLTLWDAANARVDIEGRLGWLDVVPWMENHINELSSWAIDLVDQNRFDTILLLGMGGSSLAPEVFWSVFGQRKGFPALIMLDTTSPDQILNTEIDLTRTLVIVSSKSGGTVETADLMSYFYQQVDTKVENPGSHFVAITDPGSALENHAEELGFLKSFLNPPNIGGRYSALSYFGLVPAVLIGVNLGKLLNHVKDFVDSTQSGVEADKIISMSERLANLPSNGLNVLNLALGSSIKSLAIWIDQLIAESTGKNGVGIIPVNYDEQNSSLGENAVTVQISLEEESSPSIKATSEIGSADKCQCDFDIQLRSKYDLGGEFLRWQIVTALAAAKMGINPFDQPNVEEAKIKTREILEVHIPIRLTPRIEESSYWIADSSDHAIVQNYNTLEKVIKRLISRPQQVSGYIAILAYLPMEPEISRCLERLKSTLSRKAQLVATLGFGPRYLHSTGQLHKGGPEVGCFIQITEESHKNVSIPGRSYDFYQLHRAQSDGDYSILAEKNLPIMRITLKGDRLKALEILLADIDKSMAG